MSQSINNYVYTPGFQTGQYHNAVLCISGNVQSLYLNGTLIATQTAASNILTSYSTINEIVMGCAGDRSCGFSGYLDDFRMYNYALSTTQISNLYINRNIVTYYPFDSSLNGLTPNYATLTYDANFVGNVLIDTSAGNIMSGSGALSLQNTGYSITSYVNSTPSFSTSYTSGLSISLWFKTTGVFNTKMRLFDLCTAVGSTGISVDIKDTNRIIAGYNGYPITRLQTAINLITINSRYLWLDASSSSNFTFSSGNNISQWNGSNGGYGTSAITATRVSSSPNSYVNYNTASFNFSASNYYSTSSTETFFIVFSTPSTIDSNFNFICLGAGGTGSSGQVGRVVGIRKNFIIIIPNNVGLGNGFQGYFPYDLSSNTTYVVSFTMDYTDSTYTNLIVRLNGNNITKITGNIFNFNQNNSVVGTNFGYLYSPYNGSVPIVYINEIIGINNCLMPLSDILDIESYLVNKWANINYLYVYVPTISTNSVINKLTSTTRSAILNTGKTLSAGAYGVILLYGAYTGPVMTIRRSSDSGIMNFYADISGNLGTGYFASGTSLTTWLSGATAYVTQWWDQTGNGNHATQTTINAQPVFNTYYNNIDFSVYDTCGNAWFSLPNGALPYGTTNYSYVFKHGIINNNLGTVYSGGNSYPSLENSSQFNSFGFSSGGYRDVWWNNDRMTNGNVASDNAVITNKYDGTNRYIYVNGVSQTLSANANYGTRNQLSTLNALGKIIGNYGYPDLFYFNSQLYYFYFMPISISDTDRSVLENTQITSPYYPTSIIDTLSSTTKNNMLYRGTSLSAGVYGVMLLYGAYQGPVMTIRRSSDSISANFFTDTSGNLGTGYLATGTSLSTWLNGATAYVTQWWDQTGNDNHATQTTTSSQPIYNTTGKYIDFSNFTSGGNTNAYFNLPNSAHPYGDSEYTYVFKYSSTNNNYALFGGGSNTGADLGNSLVYYPFYYNNYWLGDDMLYNTTYTENANTTISIKFSKSSTRTRTMYLNGSNVSTQLYINATLIANNISSNIRNQPNTNNYIGQDIQSRFLNGRLYYSYIIPIAISEADRNILEATPTTTYTYTRPTSVIDKLSATTKTEILNSGTRLSAGVYGVILLYSAYAGPVMTIRRSSDSASFSFYADTSGNLGTGYLATGISLTTWLSGATAYVTQWWDQTGNGNHATQTDNTIQPIYDITNKCITFTATSATISNYFNLPNGTHPYNNSNYTYISKYSTTNYYGGLFGAGLLINSTAAATNYTIHGFGRWGVNSYGDTWWGNDLIMTSGYDHNNVISTSYDGSNRYICVNGSLLGSQAISNNNIQSTYNYIGTRGSQSMSIGQNYNGLSAGTGRIYYLYILPTYLPNGNVDKTILENTPSSTQMINITTTNCSAIYYTYGTDNSAYNVFVFNTSGTLTTSSSTAIKALVVGGGGGASYFYGGGGGGGQVTQNTLNITTADTITINVGLGGNGGAVSTASGTSTYGNGKGGGTGATDSTGCNGGSSSIIFTTNTSLNTTANGGYGATRNGTSQYGGYGGWCGDNIHSGGVPLPNNYGGGGGGGAGTNGGNGGVTNNVSGNGGNGMQPTLSGLPVSKYFGGGGGAVGGLGGGGNALTSGTANTGGGGGGDCGAGGSGVVYISILSSLISNVYKPMIDQLSSTTRNYMLNSGTTLSAGAYGTKLLYSNYTGAVMFIQRDDTATQDFFADSYGNLGTALGANGTSFSSWVGTRVAYVRTWYDQTGNGNHATQNTASLQPLYDPVNKRVTFSTGCFFNLPNGTHPYGDSEYSYVFKFNTSSTIKEYAFFGGGTDSNPNQNNFVLNATSVSYYPNAFFNYWNDSISVNFYPTINTDYKTSLIFSKSSGRTRSIYNNNNLLISSSTSTIRTQSNTNNYLGADVQGRRMNGSLYYMYIVPIAISDADRIILEST